MFISLYVRVNVCIFVCMCTYTQERQDDEWSKELDANPPTIPGCLRNTSLLQVSTCENTKIDLEYAKETS